MIAISASISPAIGRLKIEAGAPPEIGGQPPAMDQEILDRANDLPKPQT